MRAYMACSNCQLGSACVLSQVLDFAVASGGGCRPACAKTSLAADKKANKGILWQRSTAQSPFVCLAI